jgi:hypothetical protein
MEQQDLTGIEELLAMAAADGRFAVALLEDRQRAVDASGVVLSPAQRQMLHSIDDEALRQMVLGMAGTGSGERRRAFLGRAAAALATLASGAMLAGSSGCRCADPVEAPAPLSEPDPVAEPKKGTFNAATAGKPTPMPAMEGIKHPGETTGIRPDTPPTAPRRHKAPRVRVVLDHPKVAGALKPAEVRSLMLRHNDELIRCFNEEQKKSPDLAGAMTVAFTIASAGQVSTCSKVSSTLDNAAMEGCVTGAIQRWLFLKPTDGKPVKVKVKYMFYRTRRSGMSGGKR